MLPDLSNPLAIAEAMPYLTPEERRELDRLLTQDMPVWMPQVGPQTNAINSLADIVFYGGQAGGGKTDLLIGVALTLQEHSIIFRREAVQLVGIVERTTSILGGRTGFNGQDNIWHIPGKERRVLEFGSVKEAEDWTKYQGRPHDAKLFDEICHFLESQFRTLIGWMRTDNPSIRQRVICAGNPPTSAEGAWVIRFWAPWLDPLHPNPAKPGELRWFISDVEGKDEEVAGPGKYNLPNGDEVEAKSRTFIRSSVDDNLYLTRTGYKATLQALPEPLRSQMLKGDFGAGQTDPVWQLIPTEWIKQAQARWTKRDAKGPMTALGLDVSRGGQDNTVAARRHDTWFDELCSAPGMVTSDGPKAAAFAIPLIRNGAPVVVDAIGVGGAALDFLKGLNVLCYAHVGSEKSDGADKTGSLRYRNKRAEGYWNMREALDPTNPEPISLPPDADLLTELAAQRYKVVTNGRFAALQVGDKDDVRKLIGRSPDRADAVAMTFASDIPKVVAQTYQRREAPDWRVA
jgi:hypothetical protein